MHPQPTRLSECKSCKYANDLKGCVSSNAEAALKLLAEGKTEEAQKNLLKLQKHLIADTITYFS